MASFRQSVNGFLYASKSIAPIRAVVGIISIRLYTQDTVGRHSLKLVCTDIRRVTHLTRTSTQIIASIRCRSIGIILAFVDKGRTFECLPVPKWISIIKPVEIAVETRFQRGRSKKRRCLRTVIILVAYIYISKIIHTIRTFTLNLVIRRISKSGSKLRKQRGITPNYGIDDLGIIICTTTNCEVHTCHSITGNRRVKHARIRRNTHSAVFVVEDRGVDHSTLTGDVNTAAFVGHFRYQSGLIIIYHTLVNIRIAAGNLSRLLVHINSSAVLYGIIVKEETTFYTVSTRVCFMSRHQYTTTIH